jgi:hypothetical protein
MLLVRQTYLLVLITVYVSCNKPPTFQYNNQLDPFSDNYSLLPPGSFDLVPDYQNNTITFTWEPSTSKFFDGYILTGSQDSTFDENDPRIMLEPNENHLISEPLLSSFDQFYKIETYFEKQGQSIYSDSLTASVNSTFDALRYHYYTRDSSGINEAWVSFKIQDVFFLNNVSVQVQESVDGSEFTDVYESFISSGFEDYAYFIDYPVEDYEFRHRFYNEEQQTEYFYYNFGSRSNCTEMDPNMIRSPSPQYNNIEAVHISVDSLKLRWFNFDYCVDEFILYEGENGSGGPWSEWQRTGSEQKSFTIANLDTTIVYQFWVVSVLNGEEGIFEDPTPVLFQNGRWIND